MAVLWNTKCPDSSRLPTAFVTNTFHLASVGTTTPSSAHRFETKPLLTSITRANDADMPRAWNVKLLLSVNQWHEDSVPHREERESLFLFVSLIESEPLAGLFSSIIAYLLRNSAGHTDSGTGASWILFLFFCYECLPLKHSSITTRRGLATHSLKWCQLKDPLNSICCRRMCPRSKSPASTILSAPSSVTWRRAIAAKAAPTVFLCERYTSLPSWSWKAHQAGPSFLRRCSLNLVSQIVRCSGEKVL